MYDGQVTLDAYYHEDQYAGGVGESVNERVNFTQEITHLPAVTQIIRQCLVNAEYSHAEIRHCQIRQEEIRDTA